MDIVKEMRSFEIDHKPDGWPAIQMKQVSALCDEIERLRATVVGERELKDEHMTVESLLLDRITRLQSVIDEANAQNSVAKVDSVDCDCTGGAGVIDIDGATQLVVGQPLYARPIPAQQVKESDLTLLPITWSIHEKATCFCLTDGGFVVANLVGENYKENAAYIANAIETMRLESGQSPAVAVPEVPDSEMIEAGILSLDRGMQLFGENTHQIISNIWEDMYEVAALSNLMPPSEQQDENIVSLAEFSKGWSDWFKSDEHGVTVVKTQTLNKYLEGNQSPRITEQECNTYDLDKMSWDAIKLAANESGWIPKEYYMNDWVSDVCAFLRNCRSDRVTEQDAREIGRSIIEFMFESQPYSIDYWLHEEGRALLNKLNENKGVQL